MEVNSSQIQKILNVKIQSVKSFFIFHQLFAIRLDLVPTLRVGMPAWPLCGLPRGGARRGAWERESNVKSFFIFHQ
jgi:hypothetical protein